jgi:dihydrofolate reductase
MRISLVVAASENDVIGAEGGIPWRLPDDQQFFKRLTLGHHIVMGRGTYESIGRLLPGRSTIIVSRNRAYAVGGAVVANSLDDALDHARERDDDEVFIVGGASLYRLALPIASRLHLTRVHAEIAGDVGFPDRAALLTAGWKLIDEQAHEADDRHAHAFTIQLWERSGSGER